MSSTGTLNNLNLVNICVSYVIQCSCDNVAAMTLLHIG